MGTKSKNGYSKLVSKSGHEYYRVRVKAGIKKNKAGVWVDDIRCFYGDTPEEAVLKKNLFLNLQNNGGDKKMEYVGVLVDQWINAIFIRSSLANSTKHKYISAYKRVFENTHAAGMKISELTSLDLQNLYNNSTESMMSIRDCHNLMSRFYKYAELNGISKDITKCIVIPRKKSFANAENIDTWDDEDLIKVINHLEGTTLRFVVVLAVNTGLRISELLALKYTDIKNGILHVNKQLSEIKELNPCKVQETTLHLTDTKTLSSIRSIPLSKVVLEELEKHKALHKEEMQVRGYKTDFIFTTYNGKNYYRKNLTDLLRNAYDEAGVPYHRFHSFRHTFGTNLSRAGVSIEETASLMGHSSINVTAGYYINIDAERKRAAMEKISSFSCR